MDIKEKQKINIAEKIIEVSRDTLFCNLSYLASALNQLKYYPVDRFSILTDGNFLFFNPDYILESYKAGKEIPVRNFLHIILHCLFRHMCIGPDIDRPLWDLAADIAVENIIREIDIPTVHAPREKKQIEYLHEFSRKTDILTAEKIYHELKRFKISPVKAAEIRACFYADNHELWYMQFSERIFFLNISEDEYGYTENSGYENVEETWKNIAENIQRSSECISKNIGNQKSSLIVNLKEPSLELYDYAEFLRKFAIMHESMCINADEFDYIFYSYGLQLYKNMPLVEPLEYKDEKKIKDFIIAIDTSGSTIFSAAEKFIIKTFNILKSTGCFFSDVNIYIIQCDSEIQECIKLSKMNDVDNYIKDMKLHGGGGTDFRPVFRYVDELIKAEKFTNLKGLLYFTDGYGVFPEMQPDYETVFVFIKEELNNTDIPPWAMKFILSEDDLEE